MNCSNCSNLSPGEHCIKGAALAAYTLMFIHESKQSMGNLTKAASIIFPISLVVGFVSKEILNRLGFGTNPTWRKRAVLIITPLIAIPLGSILTVKIGLAPSIWTGIVASFTAFSVLMTLSTVPLAFNAPRFSLINLSIKKLWELA